MFYVLLYYQMNKFDTMNYFTYADSALYVILFILIFYLNFIYIKYIKLIIIYNRNNLIVNE